MGILSKVSQREKLGALPEELALRLAQASERNLRRALLMLEACHVQQGKWTEDQEVRGCCRGLWATTDEDSHYGHVYPQTNPNHHHTR